MSQLLYATSNPGKIMEVRAILRALGQHMVSPPEIGLVLNIPEPGSTLQENAATKARGYLEHLAGEPYVVIGDDTGIEIDALNGEPGIHVRRWTGQKHMTDEEIITYCMARMKDVPPGQRGAQFRTVLAIGAADEHNGGSPLEFFEGTLRGVILKTPADLHIEGFPFESMFYVPEWGKVLGEIHNLPFTAKAAYQTHRDKALRAALPRIRELLGGST
ncbi:MAG: non-canonical purine NTP pyrophosphatase [Anaerolineae bacterium]|nr:non-canonical purine NTP pyrophosphatase [Anaerolineae bacterium]